MDWKGDMDEQSEWAGGSRPRKDGVGASSKKVWSMQPKCIRQADVVHTGSWSRYRLKLVGDCWGQAIQKQEWQCREI